MEKATSIAGSDPTHIYFEAISQAKSDASAEVQVDEGQQLSLAHGCQFYEVSAAESAAGAALAFQGLLREARSVQLLRALPIWRKLGVQSVSRVFGTIFRKNTTKDRKKRPSLSI
ncbi:hypothetical protein PV327_002135 [Microctonus hyperodae]|uniref:Uncharacterized protein n=1 Tax=Microctonus hyperodae TaxID=165561 RepID=A0AA39FEX7_MICHY|nr:hypothetical protein PV327_002135 [Microctonus hyperodae]